MERSLTHEAVVSSDRKHADRKRQAEADYPDVTVLPAEWWPSIVAGVSFGDPVLICGVVLTIIIYAIAFDLLLRS